MAASQRERMAFIGITVAVAGLMVMSGVLQVIGRTSVSGEAKVGAVSVTMKNTEFAPTQLLAKVGQPAKFVVKNSDPFVHTFTIQELGISDVILGGSEKLVELDLPRAGEFEYHCVIAGHDDMKGNLIVTQ